MRHSLERGVLSKTRRHSRLAFSKRLSSNHNAAGWFIKMLGKMITGMAKRQTPVRSGCLQKATVLHVCMDVRVGG
jgi:hypothetical protein